jgi:hypothetical protein
VLIIALAALMTRVLQGDPETASLWASVVSGMATLGLVFVTLFYVFYTRKLVNVMQESQHEEKEFREKRRRQELDKLRKALLQEIQSIEGLNELSRKYQPGHSGFTQLVPSTVYESNSSNIGLLTEKEIEAVVEFYTVAEIVNDHLAVQRDMDTEIGWGIFEQVYRSISQNQFFERKSRKKRTEATADRIGDLADAQKQAVWELKSNLDEQGEQDRLD